MFVTKTLKKYGTDWCIPKYSEDARCISVLCTETTNELLQIPDSISEIKFTVSEGGPWLVKREGSWCCWWDHDHWRPMYREAADFLVRHFGEFTDKTFTLEWSDC